MKKLELKKLKISVLRTDRQANINGGKMAGITYHDGCVRATFHIQCTIPYEPGGICNDYDN